MRRKKKGSIEWLEFEQLQEFPEVRHAVFLRGDEFDLSGVKQHQQILDLMGLEKGVRLKQCHQAMVASIKKAESGWSVREGYDGAMTRDMGVGLLIRHADCQAAIFYDPEQRAIANVHSGWRGNVFNIYHETISRMQKQYGCDPTNLRVCISPSLGPEWAEFKHFKAELPEHFWAFQVKPSYFDFWAISRMQLLESGVLEKHIEIAGICTYSNERDYFSYRRDQGTANNATIVALERA